MQEQDRLMLEDLVLKFKTGLLDNFAASSDLLLTEPEIQEKLRTLLLKQRELLTLSVQEQEQIIEQVVQKFLADAKEQLKSQVSTLLQEPLTALLQEKQQQWIDNFQNLIEEIKQELGSALDAQQQQHLTALKQELVAQIQTKKIAIIPEHHGQFCPQCRQRLAKQWSKTQTINEGGFMATDPFATDPTCIIGDRSGLTYSPNLRFFSLNTTDQMTMSTIFRIPDSFYPRSLLLLPNQILAMAGREFLRFWHYPSNRPIQNINFDPDVASYESSLAPIPYSNNFILAFPYKLCKLSYQDDQWHMNALYDLSVDYDNSRRPQIHSIVALDNQCIILSLRDLPYPDRNYIKILKFKDGNWQLLSDKATSIFYNPEDLLVRVSDREFVALSKGRVIICSENQLWQQWQLPLVSNVNSLTVLDENTLIMSKDRSRAIYIAKRNQFDRTWKIDWLGWHTSSDQSLSGKINIKAYDENAFFTTSYNDHCTDLWQAKMMTCHNCGYTTENQ